jgi:hypothetical protein
MFDMSVPKILLIEDVRFAGFALAATWGPPTEVDIVALWGWWLEQPSRSVARLNEFLLITITLEFSLLPFFKS